MESIEKKINAEKTEDTNLRARYERYKDLLKNFTIMNDVFMRNVFKDQDCTEYVLQVIMKKKDLKVQEQVIQKDYKNLQGRSAILDCVALDGDEKQYNVEIQQDNEGASLLSGKLAEAPSARLDEAFVRVEGRDIHIKRCHFVRLFNGQGPPCRLHDGP